MRALGIFLLCMSVVGSAACTENETPTAVRYKSVEDLTKALNDGGFDCTYYAAKGPTGPGVTDNGICDGPDGRLTIYILENDSFQPEVPRSQDHPTGVYWVIGDRWFAAMEGEDLANDVTHAIGGRVVSTDK